MPNEAAKSNSFNLINKNIVLEENKAEEKDWYVLLNVLVICFTLAISTMAFLFNLNLNATKTNKLKKINDKINNELNIPAKDEVNKKIASLDNKATIYKQFTDQNFDVNKFYDEVKNLYPELDILKFEATPSQNTINLTLELNKNGYMELPNFINKIRATEKYKNTIISDVTFELPGDKDDPLKKKHVVDSLDKPETIISKVSLIIDRSPK